MIIDELLTIIIIINHVVETRQCLPLCLSVPASSDVNRTCGNLAFQSSLSCNFKMTMGTVQENKHNQIRSVSIHPKLPKEYVVRDPSSGYLKSPNNRLTYKDFKLKNGLRVILISDPKFEESDGDKEEEEDEEDDDDQGDSDEKGSDEIESAAALCVNVGSLEDPTEVQGLAHLLEHVLSMGNAKYPEENSFDNFLGNVGGMTNANTSCMLTTFEFECPKSHFGEALDRFAHCFISPLLKESSIEKEVSPVDTEFLESTAKDDHRLEQFLTVMTKQDHPLATFSWGNKSSLLHKTKEKGINLKASVQKFWRDYYLAENMTLCVQSQQSFESLMKMIQIFQQIPSGLKVPADKRTTRIYSPPYDKQLFHRLYYIKPIEQTHRILISWSLPPTIASYKTKPVEHLASIIGHEGKGSIASYLRKTGLALDVAAGNDMDTGNNCHHFKFCIEINLTDDGIKNVDQVVRAVFAYLKMLRGAGPQESLYREDVTISLNEIRFEEEASPNSSTKEAARKSFFYDNEFLLLGSKIFLDFDHKLIHEYLMRIVPAEANVVILSSGRLTDADYTSKEPWMDIPFRSELIPASWMNEDDSHFKACFHLPNANSFIPRELKLLSGKSSDIPQDIVSNSHLRLWFTKNTSFKTPRAFVYFVLQSPIVSESAMTNASIDLYLACLGMTMTEHIYPASIAGQDYSVFLGNIGLTFQFEGWSEVLPSFVRLFLQQMVQFKVDEKTFRAVQGKVIRNYKNINSDQSKLGSGIRCNILEPVYWSALDKLRAIQSITLDQMNDNIGKLFEKLYMECLVEGNFESFEAKDLVNEIRDIIDFAPLEAENRPKLQVNQLPAPCINRSETYIRVASFNQSEKNSFICNYYQLGLFFQRFDIRDFCRLDIFTGFMYERAFDYLRTKNSLGYSVFSSGHNNYGVGGFSVTVLSPADQFSCTHVELKIEEFLQKPFFDFIDTLDSKTYDQMVQSLIDEKGGPDLYLKEQVERNWHEILTRNYCFDRLDLEIKELKKIKLLEFKRWAADALRSRSYRRKLSIQVVGKGLEAEKESESLAPDTKSTNYQELKLLKSKSVPRIPFVNSIQCFKASLTPYPVQTVKH